MRDNQRKDIKDSQLTISLIGRVVNSMKRDSFKSDCLTLDYSSLADEMEDIYNKEHRNPKNI